MSTPAASGQVLDRLHVTMQSSASTAGGLNGVALGLAAGQRALGLAAGVQSGVGPVHQGELSTATGTVGLGSGLVPARVVHFHFALTALFQWRRLVGRQPRVLHFHGPWALEGRYEGESRLRTLVKTAVERLAQARSPVVVAHSHSFARLLTATYGVAPDRIDVVHPGVDLDRFRPAGRPAARVALGLPADRFLVGACRRLVPRMGLESLLHAAARRPDVSVAIAGRGPSRPALEALAGRLGIADRVHFLGYVPAELLNTFYNAVDVTAIPSTALEGFGLTVLESRAAGTPVVASRVGGLDEAMGPANDRWLFEPGDDDGLAVLLDRVRAERPRPADVRAGVADRSWAAAAAETERVVRRRIAP